MGNTRSPIGILALAVVLTLALPAPHTPRASADVVTLKDGRVFEGKVLEDERRYIVIDTVVHNVRMQERFERIEIANVEYKALHPNFFPKTAEEKKKEMGKAGAPARRDGSTPYLEIPLKGTFGEEIQPNGVRNALQRAKRLKIRHIVFTLESGGGYVWAAEEIAALMAEHADDFTYHTVINHAISASIWVVFSSEHIFVARESTFGGAVMYSTDRSTGAAEVDEKMNGIVAAKIATWAERNGHNTDVVRAMMLMDAELYEWKDRAGRTVVGAAPPGSVDARLVDGKGTVLTLTGEETLSMGVARARVRDAHEVGVYLGITDWRSAGNFGATLMAAAVKTADRTANGREKVAAEINAVIDKILGLIDLANKVMPGAFSDYVYYVETGELTAESRGLWRRRTKEAISLWNDVETELDRYNRLLARAQRLGITISKERRDDLRLSNTEIDKIRRELRKQQNRTHRSE